MTRQLLIVALVIAVCLLVLLPWVTRRLSIVSFGLAANEESQAVLQTNLADLRSLSKSDPANAAVYHRHFEETQALLRHLQILALSRRELTRRTEATVLGGFIAIVACSAVFYMIEQQRRGRRLSRLNLALASLSRGEGVVAVGDHGRDVIARFASMIEETSRVIVRERQRVQYLEHLSSWQEAARRHAHEMRTPLTTARMEVTSLMRSIAPRIPDAADELQQREESILQELERLRRFTNNFVAFAALPSPVLRTCDLAQFATDFCTLFAPNWPQLTLRIGELERGICARADAAMLRQVLVNLCNNSALAIGAGGKGNVALSVSRQETTAALDVSDDGPGIPAEVRRRLFQPYTTTRKIGEGIGLGLAISKKILLDHDGDLELLPSGRGTTFRLILPRVEC
jgi:two-component system nitrogen regulation sensor histidine kinase NtrY